MTGSVPSCGLFFFFPIEVCRTPGELFHKTTLKIREDLAL